MPYASNPMDGVRTYFEDAGGSGPPVVVYAGLMDPLEWSRASSLAGALGDEFRLIYADHRGHGRSDKPHDAGAYALRTRVADAVAVLNALDIERAHLLGFSWGARLGFAIGEHTPERVSSLVLCGNQPYTWESNWTFVPMLTSALTLAKQHGMRDFVEDVESALGERFSEGTRNWMLANDPVALDAAWRSSLAEGPISEDLRRWRVPCLIYAGTEDEMHDNAKRAAGEIPGAVWLSLAGHTHLSAADEVDEVLPRVRELFHSTAT